MRVYMSKEQTHSRQCCNLFITALHVMQTRYAVAMRILSVRLSVRQSVTRVNCDKTEERCVQIFIPYQR